MKRVERLIIWFLLLLLLIIYPGTVQNGVRQGIELCLWTLIPTLFPFMVLTALLSPEMQCLPGSVFSRLERMLRIPHGCFSIFILGLLGGYPIGAKCICQAVKENSLSTDDSRRMLCFCSNAGPSFIFGLGMSLLGSFLLCMQIWLCQILSAYLLGVCIPGAQSSSSVLAKTKPITLSQALKTATTSIVIVCGWVVFFRVLLHCVDTWFLCYTPEVVQIIVYALLELANGCLSLQYTEPECIKFVLFSMFLAFGGLCVYMQIKNLAENAGADCSLYLPTKACQSLLAGILAFAVYHGGLLVLLICFAILMCIPFILRKITTGIFHLRDV